MKCRSKATSFTELKILKKVFVYRAGKLILVATELLFINSITKLS